MGGPSGGETASSRRDQLVLQLLEERRQRLEQRLHTQKFPTVHELYAQAKEQVLGNLREVPGFTVECGPSQDSVLAHGEKWSTIPSEVQMDDGTVAAGPSLHVSEHELGGADEVAPVFGQKGVSKVVTEAWPDDEANAVELTFGSMDEQGCAMWATSDLQEQVKSQYQTAMSSSYKPWDPLPVFAESPAKESATRHTALSSSSYCQTAATPPRGDAGGCRWQRNAMTSSHPILPQHRTEMPLPAETQHAWLETTPREQPEHVVQPAAQDYERLLQDVVSNDLAAMKAADEPLKNRNFHAKLKEWSLRHKVGAAKKEMARHEKENQELTECTFRPKINGKSEFYASRARGCYVESLAERLHHEADKRATLRQKAKELLDADALSEYTFRPQINRSSSARRPRRASEPGASGSQGRSAKNRAAQEANCTFRPQISERSAQIMQKKRDKAVRAVSQGDREGLNHLRPVEERLYVEAMAREERRLEQQDAVLEAEPSAPLIDEESRKICKNSVYFRGPQQDFVTRQKTFELAKQKRLEVRTQHLSEKCPFRPECQASRQILTGNVKYMGETPEDLIERLAVRDAEKREQRHADLQREFYSECTFKPQIDKRSKALAANLQPQSADSAAGGSEAVHERLYRSTIKRSKSVEDVRPSPDCSFTPNATRKTAKRWAHIKPHYGSDGRKLMAQLKEDVARRQEHIAEKRRQLEAEEAARCTFAPGPSKPYEDANEPVIVSGLTRFFELRELASRQQKEQQERELRAFRPELGGRLEGVTIPEPFALSTGPRKDGTWRHRVAPPDMEECTFAPQTNETAKRELLQQILASQGADAAG